MTPHEKAVTAIQKAITEATKNLKPADYARVLSEVEDHCSALVDSYCEENGLDRREEGL